MPYFSQKCYRCLGTSVTYVLILFCNLCLGTVPVDGSPRQVEWGSAPLLIRVGDEPGEIRVRARLLHEGSQTPREAPVLVIPVGADDALSLPSAG